MTIVLFNKQHQTITKQKTCYNWEYARGKILADNYVSILILMIFSFKSTVRSEIYC